MVSGTYRVTLSICGGEEFDSLSADAQERLALDFRAACDETQYLSGPEYLRRIGRGNIRAYLDCLRAGDAKIR